MLKSIRSFSKILWSSLTLALPKYFLESGMPTGGNLDIRYQITIFNKF